MCSSWMAEFAMLKKRQTLSVALNYAYAGLYANENPIDCVGFTLLQYHIYEFSYVYSEEVYEYVSV